MRLAIYKWNAAIEGSTKPLYYYGFKTKKSALEFINNWNSTHTIKLKLLEWTINAINGEK